MEQTIARSPLILIMAALALALPSARTQSQPEGIRVELDQVHLALHVTVSSQASSVVMIGKWQLPWGNANSMILVAVTDNKGYVDRNLLIDDPTTEQVSMKPNESMSGDVSLQEAFAGLDSALKKSDVHLFWAYQSPKELHIPRWSGGWILIPQKK
jgi:hypothetical protein